jgi:hypothetical protein
VWRIREAKGGAEPVALLEHHNLCTSPVIGTNIDLILICFVRGLLSRWEMEKVA